MASKWRFEDIVDGDEENSKGKFGLVYVGVAANNDSEKCALKLMNNGLTTLKMFEDETRILARIREDIIRPLNIRSLLELYDSWSISPTHHIIAAEYLRGETLLTHVKNCIDSERRFGEDQLRNVLIPVFEGLVALHQHNILHLDIKVFYNFLELFIPF
jgi:serine/threonine protein kinase